MPKKNDWIALGCMVRVPFVLGELMYLAIQGVFDRRWAQAVY